MFLKYFIIICSSVSLIQSDSISPGFSFTDIKTQEWFVERSNSRSQSNTGLREGTQQTLTPTKATDTQFPYQVAVEANGLLCGGSIYNSTFIITSARCVYRLVGKDVLVYVNSTYIPFASAPQENQKMGTLVNVKYVYVHGNYSLLNISSRSVPVNDIALLELEQELKLKAGSGVSNIPLNKKNIKAVCTVTGWEVEKDNEVTFSADLQYVNVNITKFSDSPLLSRSGAICIGVENNNADIGEGDPGGPLVCNGFLTGILSFKNGCNSSYYSYVWTDVSYYNSWIIDGHPEPNQGGNGGLSTSSYSKILITFFICTLYIHSSFTKYI